MEQNVDNTKASFGMKLLCFFMPLAGLIIYTTNLKRMPNYAKSCGVASLIGFIVGIVITIIMVPIIFVSAHMFRNVIRQEYRDNSTIHLRRKQCRIL